jgi:hypothetical protein
MKKPVIILSLTLALVAGIAVVERHQLMQQEKELHSAQVKSQLPQWTVAHTAFDVSSNSASPASDRILFLDDAGSIPVLYDTNGDGSITVPYNASGGVFQPDVKTRDSNIRDLPDFQRLIDDSPRIL